VAANDIQVGGTHYKNLSIQPWDAMEQWLTPEQFKGFLRGCGLKYMARAGSKEDELLDAKKAHHFVSKWIEVIEKERGEIK
jgi:hypothetical protein